MERRKIFDALDSIDQTICKLVMLNDLIVTGELDLSLQGTSGFWYFLESLKDEIEVVATTIREELRDE